MSTVVTGRFEGLIQAEEALSECLMRFPQEDVVLVPGPAPAGGDAYILIRARRAAERQLAVRTLQGRGAGEVEVVLVPQPVAAKPRGAYTRRARSLHGVG
jgi:hypothetical protein